MTRQPTSSRYGQPGRQPNDYQAPSQEEIRRIIEDGDVEALVKVADRVGKQLKEQNLTTNQIRNVFGTVRQIQMRWKIDPQKSYRDTVLLRPKLAYFAEREKRGKSDRTAGMETLQNVLDPAITLLSSDGQPNAERFSRFVEFFEAIVAYHKKYGGK